MPSKSDDKTSNLSIVEKKHGQQGGPTDKHIANERKRIEQEEDIVVVDSDQSFPASDPPSSGQFTGAKDIEKKE